MTQSSGFDFTKFVPGFDFLKNLTPGAASSGASAPGWVAPTLDPATRNAFVFVDLPGYQTRHVNVLNRSMNRQESEAARDCDLVLFVMAVMGGRVIPMFTANARQVRVRRVGPDVEFRVDDFGPGIPPDNLQRVFDAWGLDRCLWGTDWTRTYPLFPYINGVDPFRLNPRLSASDKANLMGETCARVYGWKPKSSWQQRHSKGRKD